MMSISGLIYISMVASYHGGFHICFPDHGREDFLAVQLCSMAEVFFSKLAKTRSSGPLVILLFTTV